MTNRKRETRFAPTFRAGEVTELHDETIQRLRARIPGAPPTTSGHYRLLRTVELEEWVKENKCARSFIGKSGRKRLKERPFTAEMFDIKVEQLNAFARRSHRILTARRWNRDQRNELLHALKPFVDLHKDLSETI